ncbi:hypothetical protein evm_010310 [Chilo suppressalis]|nr:hypothetical protein evm_010310 [Chilo suppressalis]
MPLLLAFPMDGIGRLGHVPPSVPSADWRILITDPNDYPEANVKYRYLAMGESMDIKVDPMVFQTENALRRVDVQKRNCWFHDEVPLGSTDRYSTETCTSECKMATYQRSCNCVPYKYPRNKRFRVCELEDLKCLHNVTGIMNTSLICQVCISTLQSQLVTVTK